MAENACIPLNKTKAGLAIHFYLAKYAAAVLFLTLHSAIFLAVFSNAGLSLA